MTIDDLREKGLILLECISGSRAYGLDTPKSDTDIKGIFLFPKNDFYGLKYIEQVNNKSNDIVFYELGRFMELLAVNNPNILELLNTPKESIIYKSELLNRINTKEILSKRCKDTFGKFALSQIKKAKGLKKKIVNPISKERKSPLSFCYISDQTGSISITEFLKNRSWKQEHCGLVNIPNMRDIYGLYYSTDYKYSGIIKNIDSNSISLSAIPKGEKQISLLYFNKDDYSSYCKDYREYWDWVEHRNDERYKSTESHGKQYDAKNMMHTFRLLHMAIEIAEQNQINVKRNDRDFLLAIKKGDFEFEQLLQWAQEKQVLLETAFSKSDLPEMPNLEYIQNLTIELRKVYYDKV